jgi:hypothetical protein
MSETQEDRPRESEPNPTQERMDEEGTSDRPVDADWEENEPSPHQGEAGQRDDVA